MRFSCKLSDSVWCKLRSFSAVQLSYITYNYLPANFRRTVIIILSYVLASSVHCNLFVSYTIFQLKNISCKANEMVCNAKLPSEILRKWRPVRGAGS